MAVLDSANLQQNSQNLAQAIQILAQAKAQVQQLTSLSSALGFMGASSSGLGSPLRSLNASLAPPSMSFDGWNLPRDMQNPNFGSVTSSRDFINQSLAVVPDKHENIAYGERDAVVQRREAAAREAALGGYSLSLAQKLQVQPALERAATLADQATNAATVMEQQRVTNYLLAAIAGELVAQRSLMAAYLEVASTQAIKASPLLFNSTPTTTFIPGLNNGPLGQ